MSPLGKRDLPELRPGQPGLLKRTIEKEKIGGAMYCPECGVEYQPGVFECSHCGILLVHELSPDAPRNLLAPADEVIVFESPVFGEADMVASALDDAGIPCSVRRSLAGGVQLNLLEPGITPGQSIALSVPRIVEDRAREIIAELRPPEDGPEIETPGASPRTKRFARILLFLLLVPLGIGLIAIVGGLLFSWFP
jgi:hypothetical protein